MFTKTFGNEPWPCKQHLKKGLFRPRKYDDHSPPSSDPHRPAPVRPIAPEGRDPNGQRPLATHPRVQAKGHRQFRRSSPLQRLRCPEQSRVANSDNDPWTRVFVISALMEQAGRPHFPKRVSTGLQEFTLGWPSITPLKPTSGLRQLAQPRVTRYTSTSSGP